MLKFILSEAFQADEGKAQGRENGNVHYDEQIAADYDKLAPVHSLLSVN